MSEPFNTLEYIGQVQSPFSSLANNNASFLEKGVLANTNYDQLCLKLRAVYRENPGKRSFFENQQKFPVYYTQLWKSGI